MKNLIMLLLNLWNLTGMFILDLVMVCWYGKLPKASVYHRAVKYTISPKKVYNDENCQVMSPSDVPERIRQRIIDNYIEALFNNSAFKNNGTTGIISILNEVKLKQ